MSTPPPFPLTSVMTVAEFLRGMPPVYGTCVSPTPTIPIKSPEELAAEAREEAAAKVLAAFRELGIDPQRRA